MAEIGKYINFSIVFAARSNNPTILNPDFLKFNGIVDESFELKEKPICTEPFAQVSYKNHINIISQLDKVVFSINITDGINEQFDVVYNIAKKYLKCIPHVFYTGIGINPKYFLKSPEGMTPERFILDNFIKEKDELNKLLSISVKFTFQAYENTKCTMEVMPGEIEENDIMSQGVIVASNFHHEIPTDYDGKIESMISILDSYKKDIDYFNSEIISKYFI